MHLPPFLRHRMAALKDWIEGRLHPARHREARRRLADVQVRSVLFVCLGNVCRSPYGERFLRGLAGERVKVTSAGFIGPDRPPPDAALEVARGRGIHHGDHRSKVITEEMLESADVILFFDRGNRRRLLSSPGVRADRLFWLGDFDPEWPGKRAITDPWGKSEAEFGIVFQRIERCVEHVWRVLERRVSP